MKEYKVINWKMGLSKNNERLEDTLNEYARNGWRVIHIGEQNTRIVFERDKNR
jgi:G:T-mismatch repair DNA endonuclease (very short patch repair protein)